MPNPVVHWEITAQDGKKAQEFYAKLFNWNVNANNPMNYGLVDTHTKKGINGGIQQTPKGTPPMVTIYIEVDDLQAYLSKAQKLGGKTVVPPTVIPNMVTFAVFADPQEGTVVGLVKAEEMAKPARASTSKTRAAKKSR